MLSTKQPDAVHCPVCTLPMKSAKILVPCGHSICEACVGKSLNVTGSTCPTCRQKVTCTVKNIALQQVVSAVEEQTPNPCSGCGEKFIAKDLKSHEENCPKVIISCDICDKKLPREEMKGHLEHAVVGHCSTLMGKLTDNAKKLAVHHIELADKINALKADLTENTTQNTEKLKGSVAEIDNTVKKIETEQTNLLKRVRGLEDGIRDVKKFKDALGCTKFTWSFSVPPDNSAVYTPPMQCSGIEFCLSAYRNPEHQSSLLVYLEPDLCPATKAVMKWQLAKVGSYALPLEYDHKFVGECGGWGGNFCEIKSSGWSQELQIEAKVWVQSHEVCSTAESWEGDDEPEY
eukprot:TRINITY_DN65713_c0_g1_i1.p1 TRINITY_DN65713_c0_g1~~TRINITY_DN65713_c0_g1_i1.p1  ORF type:complete len:346 (-),score=52.93 TRINITY_DN65713_c0_g1_i1:93-1130(-)